MPPRSLLAAAVLVLLVRVARVSWQHRDLTLAVWRAVRWQHVVGALGLLALVATVASVTVATIPGADLGLGRLTGTSSNAVFAPLEEGLARVGPPAGSGPDWPLLIGSTVFLVPLALLLPWLAFVEEELFRAGLEHASWSRVAVASLGFGLVHLLVLVPIGAAVAIGIAGFAYAVVHRRTVRAGDAAAVPAVALRVFRPTRRSRRSPTSEVHQAAGVFAATVWHTTFNTLVVLSVWASMVALALS